MGPIHLSLRLLTQLSTNWSWSLGKEQFSLELIKIVGVDTWLRFAGRGGWRRGWRGEVEPREKKEREKRGGEGGKGLEWEREREREREEFRRSYTCLLQSFSHSKQLRGFLSSPLPTLSGFFPSVVLEVVYTRTEGSPHYLHAPSYGTPHSWGLPLCEAVKIYSSSACLKLFYTVPGNMLTTFVLP